MRLGCLRSAHEHSTGELFRPPRYSTATDRHCVPLFTLKSYGTQFTDAYKVRPERRLFKVYPYPVILQQGLKKVKFVRGHLGPGLFLGNLKLGPETGARPVCFGISFTCWFVLLWVYYKVSGRSTRAPSFEGIRAAAAEVDKRGARGVHESCTREGQA